MAFQGLTIYQFPMLQLSVTAYITGQPQINFMLFPDLQFGKSLAGTVHFSPVWYYGNRCDDLKALALASLAVKAGTLAGVASDPKGGLSL